MHQREDRIVARPEAVPPPVALLAAARAPHDVEIPFGVDQEQLLFARIPRRRLHDALSVDQSEGVDQPTRQKHPRRPEGVLRAVVVHRRVVAVPDELDAFAHAALHTVRDAAVNAGSASAAKT